MSPAAPSCHSCVQLQYSLSQTKLQGACPALFGMTHIVSAYMKALLYTKRYKILDKERPAFCPAWNDGERLCLAFIHSSSSGVHEQLDMGSEIVLHGCLLPCSKAGAKRHRASTWKCMPAWPGIENVTCLTHSCRCSLCLCTGTHMKRGQIGGEVCWGRGHGVSQQEFTQGSLQCSVCPWIGG